MVKKEVVELGGEKITIKKDALRNQLKVPKSYTFTKTDLKPLMKVDVGNKFKFLGKEFKMTKLMKSRINLAFNLMNRKK